ncbi:MAG: ammonium transporter [Spirulinaceae cyanobacterium]
MTKLRRLKREKGWLGTWQACLPLTIVILLMWTSVGLAQQDLDTLSLESLKVALDTVWVIFTACLVFFMNAGFAMLETGLCRKRSAVNILGKNLIVFCLATASFWAFGFGLMFSDGNFFLGTQGFFLTGVDNSPAMGDNYQGVFTSLSWTGVPLKAKFFFQLVFAGTAATIVSGAVAERIKFFAFVLFSLLLVALAYPITGHWVWGNGWLSHLFEDQQTGETVLAFWDFAGSTIVHSVGGWAALVGAVLLGPRLGKYHPDGTTEPLLGTDVSISTLGCLILWLGWFGFNPGSTMAANPNVIVHIIVVTNMSAAAGGIAAAIASWWYFSQPDLSMITNGILGGLVGITASCAFVSTGSAAVIGLVAGTLIVFATEFLDRIKIDDPVGAVPVHLVCGIWGTIAVGLFSQGAGNLYAQGEGPMAGLFMGGNLDGVKQLLVQLIGIASVGMFTVCFSWLVWYAIKKTIGIRIPKKVELSNMKESEEF